MIVSELICFLAIVSQSLSHVPQNGFTNSKNHENMIESSLPGTFNSICETADDCTIANSACTKGICDCREGFLVDGTLTKCLKVATGYNDECEESVQCSRFLSAGGSCENSVCACKNGYHYLHGVCHLTKRLNEPCERNEECFVDTEYEAATCKDGFCKCSEGFYQREYSTCRRKANKVGDDCILDSDCVFNENAKCVSQKCALENNQENSETINAGAVLKENDDDDKETSTDPPKPLAIVESECRNDTDCETLKNSHCSVDKKCICDRAHFPSTDSTICVPEIGESCKKLDKPILASTVCKNGRWTCENGRVGVKSNQLCRKILEGIGDKCTYPEQCQLFGPRARCLDSKCACGTDSHWLAAERFCWLSKKVDEACDNDEDCDAPANSPRTVCRSTGGVTKFCSCPEKTQPGKDNSYCVQDQPELGSYCKSNEDCGVTNAFCSDKECKCKEHYFESEGSCLAGLNATCKATDDCKVNNTVCSDKPSICQCQENFVASPENECVTKSTHQQQCKYDVQCSSAVLNTYCHFETNSEKEPQKNSEAEDKYGRCECLPAHFYNMDSCFVKKWLGEECTRQGECFAEDSKSVCRNEKCSCEFDFEQLGKKCVSANSAPSAMNAQTWLLLPSATFLALKALR